jgi:hypothetical protein
MRALASAERLNWLSTDGVIRTIPIPCCCAAVKMSVALTGIPMEVLAAGVCAAMNLLRT